MRRAILIITGVLLASCAGLQRQATPVPGCRWPVAPVVLRQAADTVYLSWTYPAGQLPDQVDLSRLPALSSFLDTVRIKAGTVDPRSLLSRQIAHYASRPDSDSQGEAANGRMVLSRSVGTLRPISC